MTILGVDVETCSAADIRDGAAPYAEHESTHAHCAVFALSERRGDIRVARWTPGETLAPWVAEHVAAGRPVLAHTAGFESAIFEHVLVPHHGFPAVAIEQWRDTAAIASALNLPSSLAALGEVLGVPAPKDLDGRELMLRYARAVETPRGWAAPLIPPDEFARLLAYCERDVVAMLDCWWRLPQLPRAEQELLAVDRKINHRGVQLDLFQAKRITAMARARSEELARCAWLATGDLLGLSSQPALAAWLKERGVELPRVLRVRDDGRKEMTETISRAALTDLLAQDHLDPLVREVLTYRIESGRATSLAKAARVPDVVSRDGRLRGALRYCGAHTGRWTSQGLQLHNLAKSPKAFKSVEPQFRRAVSDSDLPAAASAYSVLDGLSFMLRGLVMARVGNELIGADYSAIEARVLAWVAGQDDVLQMFARNEDVYTEDARRIGSSDRQLGKVQRLGLGYGMGAVKFRDTAAKAGVSLSLLDARNVVHGWREANPAIVQFWRALEDACVRAVQNPAPGASEFVGSHVMVTATRDCLRVRLPSGRSLHYWRPQVRKVVKRVETVDAHGEVCEHEFEAEELRFHAATRKGFVPETTYGGKLTENVVQAIARDLLGAALLRLDRTWYDVVLHVHDSIAAEVPAGAGSVDEFVSIISRCPTWAAGLPLHAEGYRSRHFRG